MTGSLQRRLIALLAAAAAAAACLIFLPGTGIDRAAFTAISRGFANPPFFISGSGNHSDPWKLRTLSATSRADPHEAPVIVSLGDDRAGFFQSSPPSPVDMAVILRNFQRLGAMKAATAAVLAWDAPDPIGLMALDKTIGKFSSIVMAAPLSRGAVAEPMPPAFRNASVPVASVRGETTLLPVVNRIPLPGIILGSDNTRAGFQILESETATKFPPMIARWEDRIVFAFPLLVVMQRLDLPLDGVEIRPGEFLKLSPHGPIVPLDLYGRLAAPLKPVAPFARFPAETLIDAGSGIFPKQAPEPVILRDDRSAAEPATREFSQNLDAAIVAIASDSGLAPARAYPRLSAAREAIALALLALALAAISGLPGFARNTGFLFAAGVCVAAQVIAVGMAGVWLPGLAALAAVGAAFLSTTTRPPVEPPPGPQPATLPRPQPAPAPEPTPPPLEVPPAPKKRAAKKAATKAAKKAAKKTAVKTTPSRGGKNSR